MRPLAERMRPVDMDTFVGQSHLIGKDGVLRKLIESGNIHSFILWGPPGVGKTTIATIIAAQLKIPFYSLSAINSGVKDVRETIKKAESTRFFDKHKAILFIDEIHRFSKSQQDSLLHAVEKGIVTLIGATTENPSFEVISALLSRCQVYTLKPLEKDELKSLVDMALEKDEFLKKKNISISSYDALLQYSGGDARKLYNCLEIISNQFDNKSEIVITDELVKDTIQQNMVVYDKAGEMHYDIISAFIKSVRGSDPNAAVYYMARMVEGGEDSKFICRRMIILAAEDIGLANPNALLMANACFDAVNKIGLPEGRIPMSQCAIYLASSAKSNSAYMAIKAAQSEVQNSGNLSVPLHLRNAPTKLMKELDYGKNYQYAHAFDGAHVNLEYLPEEISGTAFYSPKVLGAESKIAEQMKRLWKEKYGY